MKLRLKDFIAGLFILNPELVDGCDADQLYKECEHLSSVDLLDQFQVSLDDYYYIATTGMRGRK